MKFDSLIGALLNGAKLYRTSCFEDGFYVDCVNGSNIRLIKNEDGKTHVINEYCALTIEDLLATDWNILQSLSVSSFNEKMQSISRFVQECKYNLISKLECIGRVFTVPENSEDWNFDFIGYGFMQIECIRLDAINNIDIVCRNIDENATYNLDWSDISNDFAILNKVVGEILSY